MSTDAINLSGDEEGLPVPEDLLEEEPQGAAPTEPEGEEEEMPDDLLSPAELEERTRERGAAPAAPAAREPEDRGVQLSELRELFTGLRQPAAPAREEKPAQPQIQPFTLSEEKAAELSEKILSQPGGLAKAIAWAVNQGEQRALVRMASSTEGQSALESSGESFAARYVARKLRDPDTKFGKAIEPVFDSMLEEFNLADLARMPRADRDSWLDATWERATGRALLQKATTKRTPSPGVGRGAGSRPGAPGRSRVVTRMTEQEKKDLRASAPRYFSGEEGEKRFLRQVWEIEHGTTNDRSVARSVGESMRFSEAVGFGG